jgi:hypothetical protein
MPENLNGAPTFDDRDPDACPSQPEGGTDNFDDASPCLKEAGGTGECDRFMNCSFVRTEERSTTPGLIVEFETGKCLREEVPVRLGATVLKSVAGPV